MHRDGGHAEVVTGPLRSQPSVSRVLHGAITYKTHIKGCAAGVTDDDVARQIFGLNVSKSRNRRHRRPGFDQEDRALHHVGEVHDAAKRRTGEDVVHVASRAQIGFEVGEIALHEWLQRRVDGCRRGAPILAQNGIQLV